MNDAAAPLPLALLVWLSPAFPVGSFAYSHGLEWAHEAGDLTGRASLEAWLADLLAHGSGRTDAILLAAAHRAAAAGDDAALAEIVDLAAALAPSAERHLETTTQGDAFVQAASASWPAPALDRLRALRPRGVAYPLAVGVAAAGHGLELAAVLPAYLLAFVGALVSAAVRLGVVGQTDGQRITAALVATVAAVAEDAADAGLDDLGGACLRADLASLRHETQYSRLFRS